MLRLISCACLVLLAASAFAAEVYRSVDANGTVVYSDRPGGAHTERIFIATPGAAPVPRAVATPAPAGQGRAPADELRAEVRIEPTPGEIAAERARNCALAEERADRYRVSQRLYRTLPNGEREYLSDAELDEARARADADVASWCG